MIYTEHMSLDQVKEYLRNIIDSLNDDEAKELLEYSSFLFNKEINTKGLFAFFDHMQKYAFHDLEGMRLKANYDSGTGRFAVAIAQSIFSLLDLFGYLISEKNELTDTRGNIEIALQNFFPKEIKQLQRSILIDIYRNGIMHAYFPKMCSIRNEDDEFILIQNGSMWDLNVHLFSKLLVERLIHYIDFSKKDPKALFHLTKRYFKFIRLQEKSFEKYKDNLSDCKLDRFTTETTTRPVEPFN